MTKDEIRSEVEKIITVISPDDLGGDLCTMYFALTEDQINELVDFIWEAFKNKKIMTEDEIRREVKRITVTLVSDYWGDDLFIADSVLNRDQMYEMVNFIWKLLDEVKNE